MHVTIITAFPGFFKDFLATSIIGRAVERNLITVDLIDLREFGRGRYHQIDDAAFGSGGQILTAPVMKDALDAAISRAKGAKPFVVYPSPQGVMLTQDIIETLALQEHVIILCGHYEGIDERFVEHFVDLEVTIGDCVLTGGEIPAMTIVDAMSRLVPEVVGREGAVQDDSFYRGMLDHPHYTRPASWCINADEVNVADVPEILLSGNEREIGLWRRAQAITRTLERRSDLIDRAVINDYLAVGARLAIMFNYNMPAPERESLEAICSLCRIYNLGRPFLVVTNPDCRKGLTRDLTAGLDGNFALDPVPKVFGSVKRLLEQLAGHDKSTSKDANAILVVEILEHSCTGAMHWRLAKRECLESKGPVLFLVHAQETESELDLGQGTRVIKTFVNADACNACNENGNNNLPLSIRAAIALDRLMGQR